AEVVSLLKAKICFVDVDESTFNMCPISLERSINYIKDLGMSPKVVIPVDLFGLMADYRKIEKIALQHSLKIISDAAQSFGATMNEKRVGTFGNFTTTSFFPAKPLGCYGDGGAIFTDDNFSAEVFRSIRFHGKGGHKYDNVRIGINSRLDTLQAAVLLSKMEIFQDEVDIRNSIAQVYIEELKDSFKIQKVPSGFQSVWAQFTLCLESDYCREDFINLMNKDGIPTNIYYPKPLHLQKPYLDELKDPIGLLNSEMLSKRCLSLPMHPYLKSDQQKRIIDSCINNLKLL
ncbi:MAG: aminotransferase DegT, partial [Proteobacteria bacterium]|nr:aminotransferase DegT [Pseudomonadota bacterium]